jgi:hypothetical protein
MANVYIPESVYVHESNIEIEDEEDIADLIKANNIDVADVLLILEWDLPDFQRAIRKLDIEYGLFCTKGAHLLSLFRKMDTAEQREFLSMITDSIISYYKSNLTVAWPSDL